MNINPLAIKLIRQDPKSSDCLRCCGQMVFAYFNDKLTPKQLWRRLHVYKKHSGLSGGYFVDLGIIALKRGYEVLISHYDWSWWNKETVEAAAEGGKHIISALKKLQKQKKKWGERKTHAKEIAFVEKGGRFEAGLPTLNQIDHYLLARLPVILSVRGEILGHDPKEKFSHSVLVVGRVGDNYLIRDPYFPVDKIPASELYYSWLAQGGWLMILKPTKAQKEKKPNHQQLSLIKEEAVSNRDE